MVMGKVFELAAGETLAATARMKALTVGKTSTFLHVVGISPVDESSGVDYATKEVFRRWQFILDTARGSAVSRAEVRIREGESTQVQLNFANPAKSRNVYLLETSHPRIVGLIQASVAVPAGGKVEVPILLGAMRRRSVPEHLMVYFYEKGGDGTQAEAVELAILFDDD